MLSNNRKMASYLGLAVVCMSVLAPVLADEAGTQPETVPQSVVNLDLCTLAYQLYHQSLCLPLDPWFDLTSRIGSDRRNNICRFTHDYAKVLGGESSGSNELSSLSRSNGDRDDFGFYSGPSEARGWRDSNRNLDPILSNYKHIDIRLPAFTRDGERYLGLQAPAYLVNNIKSIDGVRYKTKPTSFPSNNLEQFKILEYPNGDDHLIVFEGATGMVGESEPSWSIMGFVMMQKTKQGYDAHIAFRGSRSGAALSKTVWKAQDVIGIPKGNPDWITDLQSATQIEQPLISTVGKVTKGFAESLPTMLGPITACCKYFEEKYPAPDRIFVTGHSLGAGLASQFAGAVKQGGYGKELRNEVRSWPWENTTLMAFAQPIPGDPVWAASFNKTSPESEHYWVEGDDVVEATSNSIVSRLIDRGEHVGVQKKLLKLSDCGDNPHEVFVIRAALLNHLLSKNPPLPPQLMKDNTWGYYKSFSKMIAGQPMSYVYPSAPAPRIVDEENLQKMLQSYNFCGEFSKWLEEVYARMISEKSSYIAFKPQSTLDERGKRVDQVVEWMRRPPNDSAQELDSLANEFKVIDGELGLTAEEQWIFCGMILSRLQKTKLTLNDLRSISEIKSCLDADID